MVRLQLHALHWRPATMFVMTSTRTSIVVSSMRGARLASLCCSMHVLLKNAATHYIA